MLIERVRCEGAYHERPETLSAVCAAEEVVDPDCSGDTDARVVLGVVGVEIALEQTPSLTMDLGDPHRGPLSACDAGR